MWQYPRRDVWSYAFLTGELDGTKVPGLSGGDMPPRLLKVFIPSTPNPTTGYFLLLPEEDVKLTDLSVEEAFKQPPVALSSIESKQIVVVVRETVLGPPPPWKGTSIGTREPELAPATGFFRRSVSWTALCGANPVPTLPARSGDCFVPVGVTGVRLDVVVVLAVTAEEIAKASTTVVRTAFDDMVDPRCWESSSA